MNFTIEEIIKIIDEFKSKTDLYPRNNEYAKGWREFANQLKEYLKSVDNYK